MFLLRLVLYIAMNVVIETIVVVLVAVVVFLIIVVMMMVVVLIGMPTAVSVFNSE